MATRSVRGVSRRVCERCAHIHYADPKVAVGVAVFRDDCLLLVRRTMEPERGRWALPGGYLDVGEEPRRAAAREAVEEAGVQVTVGDVIDVFANPVDEGGAVFVLYAATWRYGEAAGGGGAAGDDADSAGFFPRDGLPDIAFASTAHAIERWSAKWQTGPP